MARKHNFSWQGRRLAAVVVVFLFNSPFLSAATAPSGWMEILPFTSWESRVVSLSGEGPLAVRASEEGVALVCRGGRDQAIICEKRFLRLGEPVVPPQLGSGVIVSGRVLLNGEGVRGVRVALAIAGLTARRPLLLPLSLKDGKVERELVTDGKGRFSTPPLAASTYHVELMPAGGRIELSEPFVVPLPKSLREEGYDASSSAPPRLDIGDLELTPGLAVDFSVIDDAGGEVSGALVSASQGKPPARVQMFRSHTDSEGRAVLSGFQPSDAIQTTCDKPGFSRVVTEYDFPPAWVECVMRPLAKLTGEVLSDAEGMAGVTLGLSDRDRWVKTSAGGRFQLPELDAGPYRLVVASPGFQIAERSGALAPGETRVEVVELEPAPRRWGRVVDAATGEPVPGARLTSIEPPGAVACRSDHQGELFFAAASNRRMILAVDAQGYPSHRVDLESEDGTNGEPWVIELAAGGRIAVTAWSAAIDGPCVGCDLSIVKAVAAGESPPATVGLRTDQYGLATSDDLAPGRYQVYLEEARSLGSAVHVRAGHDIRWADVGAGAVTEVVFGEPRQTVEIRFRPPPALGWRLRCAGSAGEAVYDPQADGSFEVRRRAGEALTLQLVAEDVSVSQGILAAETGNLVQLDLPRTSIAGHLTAIEELAARPGLNVRPLLQNGSAAWVLPAPDGRFEVSFLAAGAYRMTLGDRELATFVLIEGEALDLGALPKREEDP